MTGPINDTAPTTTVAPKPTPATTSVDRKDQNTKDTFLKLLVAQMRFQDPSKPADTSAMMAQTATFTQVEKLQELAKQNAALLASQRTLSAGAMVGQTVTYTDSTGASRTGAVTSVRIATDTKDGEAVIDGTAVPMGRITAVSVPEAPPTTGTTPPAPAPPASGGPGADATTDGEVAAG